MSNKVIDLFCGIGGFSAGAKQAGMDLVYAANHWRLACDFHDKNHPEIKAACQDVRHLNWGAVPAFDGMLASPACQGHSKARGAEKPVHDELRMTAWGVVDCMEFHRPQFGLVENVPEFLDWGLYQSWADALNRLGYAVSPHLVDAADHGVPQHRERVFIALTKSKAPIQLKLPRRPHRAAASVIQWDRYPMSRVVDKVEATRRRVESGRRRFGDRFVAPFYGSGSGETGRCVSRPLGTVTTKDRWLVVDGDRCRVLQPDENLEFMGFDPGTKLPSAKYQATKMLGNAVCPQVATDFLRALVAHM